MEDFRKKKWNRTARLQNWDYGSNASYYLRLMTRKGEEYFMLEEGTQNFASPSLEETFKMFFIPNEIGQVAIHYWNEIPEHFPFVRIDAMILKTNQLQALITLEKPGFKTWKENSFGPQSRNLGSIIRAYKAAVKKYATLHYLQFEWAARYDERLILEQWEFNMILNYLKTGKR